MSINYGKVIRVCKELFEYRNYTVDEQSDLFLRGKTNENKLIHLYILTSPKLNIDIIKHYYSVGEIKNIQHMILVYQKVVTPSVKKIITSINTFQIELFCIENLQYNLMKHELVPKHTKIDNKKKNTSKYPILRKTDAVARFLGFKYGDIIRIDRTDGSIYYRFVK